MRVIEQALKLMQIKHGEWAHVELFKDGSGNLMKYEERLPSVAWNNFGEFVKWCHDLVGAPQEPPITCGVSHTLRSCLKREMMKHKSGMVNIVLFEDGSGRLYKEDPADGYSCSMDEWRNWDEFDAFITRRAEPNYHELLDKALAKSSPGWLSDFTRMVQEAQ